MDLSFSDTTYTTRIEGLQVENLDEFTLGYERMLGASAALLIRAIRRDLRSSFQWGFDPTSENGLVLGTPGQGDFDFLPAPKREYTALELGLVGAWRDLRYRGSYVLSRTWGNYPGFFDSDVGMTRPGGSGLFFVAHQAENSTGLLPNDRTHVFKLSSSYQTGFGLSLGGFFTWQSGSPLNEWGAGYLGPGWPAFLLPRGSAGRTPSVWDLDLRLTYDSPCPRAALCRLFLDALQVGNPQEVVWLEEVHYRALDEHGNQTNENPNYLRPLAYQPPMVLRLGFEIGY
jgi:hypothetical protein